jgi:hypothetical protein
MKFFKYAAGCTAVACLSVTVLAGTATASTGVVTPPHPIFCTAELNGALSMPNAPDSLQLALPLTVADASTAVPVYKNYLEDLKAGVNDIATAAKAAPTAVIASSYSKASASYKVDLSYFKVALSTLIKMASTKNAYLLPPITAAINKASSAAQAGEVASQPVEAATIYLCTPWGTAENTADIVGWHASTLARVARTHGDGLATLEDLKSASNKQTGGPKVAVASATPSTGALKKATLSVTSSKYVVYVCLKYTKMKPQIPTVAICKHQ